VPDFPAGLTLLLWNLERQSRAHSIARLGWSLLSSPLWIRIPGVHSMVFMSRIRKYTKPPFCRSSHYERASAGLFEGETVSSYVV